MARCFSDSRFFSTLTKFDDDLRCRSAGSGVTCGGRLDSARYPRKPRGGPAGLGAEYEWRLSFCCAREGCRRRVTPPSVRYLGRRVYLGVVVVLVSAMEHGLSLRRVAKLHEHLGDRPAHAAAVAAVVAARRSSRAACGAARADASCRRSRRRCCRHALLERFGGRPRGAGAAGARAARAADDAIGNRREGFGAAVNDPQKMRSARALNGRRKVRSQRRRRGSARTARERRERIECDGRRRRERLTGDELGTAALCDRGAAARLAAAARGAARARLRGWPRSRGATRGRASRCASAARPSSAGCMRHARAAIRWRRWAAPCARDRGRAPSLRLELRQLVRQQYEEHPALDGPAPLRQSPRPPGGLARWRATRAASVPVRAPLHKRPGASCASAARVARGRRTTGRRGAGDFEMRSYEVAHTHALWHADFHHGSRKVSPPTAAGQTPLLVCFLDDHSRLVCHLQWYLEETAECFVHGLTPGDLEARTAARTADRQRPGDAGRRDPRGARAARHRARAHACLRGLPKCKARGLLGSGRGPAVRNG